MKVGGKMKKILLIFIMLLMLPISVFADELTISGNSVAVRSAPTTVNSLIKYVNSGSTYPLKSTTIVADQGNNGKCDGGWYNIDYDGTNAYVCAKYGIVKTTTLPTISAEAKTECEKELKAAGFPEDYWDGLCILKVAHPNWQFNAVQTGMSFSTAVAKESVCGKNTLETTDSEMYDSTCTASLDSGYKHASQKAVAQYLNPLNFLDEKYIFMFESNYVNTTISDDVYTSIVNSRLSSYISMLPTLGTAITSACKTNNVNQVMIASRIIQELGTTGKATQDTYKGQLLSCISGEYTTRWGTLMPDGRSMDYYYNFFNIGVNDGSNGTAAYRAVYYAVNHGWGGTGNQTNDLILAIGGGASFLKNKYMDKGQYTIYAQKFNVHPTSSSSLFVNQYMTNLKAPSSEASLAYNLYKNAGILDSSFVFYIPIFSDLDAAITNSSDGATGEDSTNTSGGLAVSTIIVNSGYKISSNYITGINPGTTFDEFKNKIGSLGGSVVSSTSSVLGTGNVLTISNGSSQSQYTILIKGDTSGDGVVNALDLLQVQKNILGQYTMSGAKLLAGDPSGDGAVNALDLLQIQKSILGQYTISQ